MTREEAIQELQNCKGLIQQDGKDYLDERDIPLLDMSIEALQWQDRILTQIEDIVLKEHGERREP